MTTALGAESVETRESNRPWVAVRAGQKVDERIQLDPALANPLYKPAAQDDFMAKVDNVLYYANYVSQPDS